jgi:hypothetical protein
MKGTSAPQHNTANECASHGPSAAIEEKSLENRYFYLDKNRPLEAKCCAAGWYRKKQWVVFKSFLFRVALVVVWVCVGVRNSVGHQGAISGVFFRFSA